MVPSAVPDRLATAAFALAAVALVGLVLAVPALYLVDLPAWTYAGALWAREVADPASTPAGLLRYPVPNAWATVLPGLLAPWAGAPWAGKLVGAVLLGGGFAAAHALARAGGHGDAPWRAAVVASTLVASSSFWNGYVGFQLGVVGAMAAGAWWLRRGRLPAVGLGAVAAGLFFCHAVPFAAFALGAGLDAVRRRDVRHVAALVPAAALTLAYVVDRPPAPTATDAGPGGVVRWAAYKAYTALKLGPFQHALGPENEGLLAGAPGVYWAAVALAAVFVAVLAGGLVWGTVRMARDRADRRAAAGYGWALVVAALALPAFALSVVNPGERVMAMGVLVLAAVVPLPRRLVVGLGLAALLFLLDDAAALWAQRAPLPAPVLAEMTAERTASARAAADAPDAPVEVGASPYAAGALPLLNHPLYLHAEQYAAADARDWTRRLFESGILRPAP